MLTDHESVCCKESEYMYKLRGGAECIKYHTSFEGTMLNIDTSQTARLIMLSQRVEPQYVIDNVQETNNRTYRIVAYRQFVSWVNAWTSLGKSQRKVIPSCIINEIRERYPEQGGHYVGFKAAAGCEPAYVD